MSKLSGIYQIQSKIKPERIYIGSSYDIKSRWGGHKRHLFNNKHDNIKLQRHYNKYGEDDLVFSVLCECERYQLIQFEQYFIDFYHPWFNIYTTAGSSFGHKFTTEQKLKLSLAHRGKKLSEEHKKKIGLSGLGRKIIRKNKVSEETRLKLSKASKGRVVSEETRDKIRKGHLGKPKPSLSIKMIGNKRGIGNKGHSGQTYSDEYKKKMSESIKLMWARRKQDKIKQHGH